VPLVNIDETHMQFSRFKTHPQSSLVICKVHQHFCALLKINNFSKLWHSPRTCHTMIYKISRAVTTLAGH
jgi:hypothetical protein